MPQLIMAGHEVTGWDSAVALVNRAVNAGQYNLAIALNEQITPRYAFPEEES